ncbi:hypothetical protein F0L74_32635 [Chitinophaga agrisoli]|uniref:Uncharacterized protein n=1 Tax=Chitinophaga agrisoli TaxID=2607653 RepID=A0A5B2VRV6_9BACT|nr:hypothetical protein [Chitinophaga agrisoli]KAA2240879.1 hypothetical protein F0L74_32635 [Chitinophaga agrisoli]
MEQDPLKSAWQQATGESGNKQAGDLRAMAGKRSYPVLKGIRRQLTIECLGYAAFLLVYYDFFDGDKRPFFLNALLVAAVAFMLLHNAAGYWVIKDPLQAGSLQQSLQTYLQKLRQYAAVSITSRLLGIAALLIFFMASIHWTSTKYWILAGGLLVLALQLLLLYRIWAGRIKQLGGIVAELGRPE